MKMLPIAVVLVSACASTSTTPPATPTASAATDFAPAPKLDQHVWLQQLVGEWNVTSEATMGPDQPPMRMESTESVRSLGDLWVVADGHATLEGQPFSTLMTLGYDPDQHAFVGTWVDTMQTHMWTYRGELDPARRVLTLSAQGPSFNDPTKLCQFHDAIEIIDANHKVMTSSMQNADGTWTTFMRADYRRKK